MIKEFTAPKLVPIVEGPAQVFGDLRRCDCFHTNTMSKDICNSYMKISEVAGSNAIQLTGQYAGFGITIASGAKVYPVKIEVTIL